MVSGVALGRRCAHEIALSDLHPTLANDVIGRGGVEVEVRQAVAKQEALTGELPCLPAGEGALLNALEVNR